jgi:hypothetical protein
MNYFGYFMRLIQKDSKIQEIAFLKKRFTKKANNYVVRFFLYVLLNY